MKSQSKIYFLLLILSILLFSNLLSSEVNADCSHWASVRHPTWETRTAHEDYHCLICSKCGAELYASPHSWQGDIMEVYQEQTCDTPGVYLERCNGCSWTRVVSDSSGKGHTFLAATCVMPKTCRDCGATEGDPLGHTPGTTYGYGADMHWQICTRCGGNANLTPHTFSATVKTAATCTTGGSESRSCSICGYKGEVEVPALGHQISSSYTTDSNYHWKVCTRCGLVVNQESHTYTSSVKSAATCTSSGVREYVCTGCSKSYTQTIPALSHQENSLYNTSDTQHWKTCLNCNQEISGKRGSHVDANGDGACDTCGHSSVVVTVAYDITPKDLTVAWRNKTFAYDGTVKKPTASVSSGVTGETVNLSVVGNGVDNGSYTATAVIDSVTGGRARVANYELSNPTQTYTIGTADLSLGTMTLSQTTYTFDGTEKKPIPTFKIDDVTLKADKDYTISYSNNIDAGTATITLTGLGNYTGTSSKTYTINPKPIAVTWENKTNFEYNTVAQAPMPSAESGVANEVLILTRTMETNIGSYTSTVTLSKVNGGRAKTSNYTLTNTTKAYNITVAKMKGSINITGENVLGQTLLANTSGIVPTGCTLTYQWYENANASTDGGIAIPQETSETYLISSSRVGKYIYVVVTATKVNYETTVFKAITDDVIKKEEQEFITEWTIPADANGTSGSGTTIKLPIAANAQNNFVVYWGDNTFDVYDKNASFPTHTYYNSTTTKYVIQIQGSVYQFGYSQVINGGNFDTTDTYIPTKTNAYQNYYTFTQYLSAIRQWGVLNANAYGFAHCINLKEDIPQAGEDSFKVANGAMANYMFFGATSLNGEVADTLFENFTQAKSFDYTFGNCSSLAISIPSNFFEKTTGVTSFVGTFSGCSSLTGVIPTNLFEKCQAVTNFSHVFENCSNISGSIPANLFAKNTRVTNFDSSFAGCKKITGTLPANLFANCPNVTNFTKTFYGCSGLTGALPAELFNKNTKVVNFTATFAECSNISGHVDGELFANCNSVRTINRIFMNCANLTTVDIECSSANVTDMAEMFSGCSKLQIVVLGSTFKDLEGADMFASCSALKAVIMLYNATSVVQVGKIESMDTIKFPTAAILYVPTKAAEAAYEKVLESKLVADRIKPILELIGDNPTWTQWEAEYVDAGYTVADFAIAQASQYTIFGFQVATQGMPVDTSMKGTRYVTYTLTKNGFQVAEVKREVIVKELRLSKLEVVMNPDGFIYDGTVKEPSIIGSIDGETLQEGRDYTITFANNTNAGTATVTLTSKGYYTEVWTGTFEIAKRELVITPSHGLVKFIGRQEPNIPYTYSNELETETPKFSGTLAREPGETAGTYQITMGTLALVTNGKFMPANYTMKLEAEVVTLIDDAGTVFVTEWTVPDGTTIQLPIPRDDDNNFIVTWGDGTLDKYTRESFPAHTYQTAGTYEIAIYGTCRTFGYTEEIAPTESNTYKDYYTFATYVTKIIQWGDIRLEKVGFANCSNLRGDFPVGTGFGELTSMENIFYHCTSLTGPIPSNFTGDAYNMKSAKNMFSGCSNLTGSIPQDLFAGKAKILSFENTFYGCSKLTGTIPVTLFERAEEAVNFQATFKNCSGLSGRIPEELFYAPASARNFRETFANCTGLVSSTKGTGLVDTIPEELFSRNTAANNFYHTFYNCTGLFGNVPENLLIHNKVIVNISNKDTEYSDYRGMFEGCIGIQKVSLQVGSIGREMFKGCTGIQEIELSKTVQVGNEAFYGCNQLTHIMIDEDYLTTIGTDAFEYTGTNPAKLGTTVNRYNDLLLSYNWNGDNRVLDAEAPKGTVEIVAEKAPFVKTPSVELKLTVTDNISKADDCTIAIINEEVYERGVTYEELEWQPFQETISWELTREDGAKVVYVYFKDEAGNICEALDYIDARIKILSSSDSMWNRGTTEISLATVILGNNQENKFQFRKEINVHKVTETGNFIEYMEPIIISQEGEMYIDARIIETTTGIIVDQAQEIVYIDNQPPEPVNYDVVRGRESGGIYYGNYYEKDNPNNGVLISITEGEDFNTLGEMGAGIQEMRYSILKDGQPIVNNAQLTSNYIYLEQEGEYVVSIYEIDRAGNTSSITTIQARVAGGE